MNLPMTYRGGDDPFEGDRTLWLRSLPAGARVTKATVTLTPVAFTDSIIFDDQTGVGEWGAMRDPAALNGAIHQATANFHARRVVSAVVASREPMAGTPPQPPADAGRVTVQIDIGGTWVGVASDGTILFLDKQPLVRRLPVEPDFGQPTPLPAVTTAKIRLTAVSDDKGTPNENGTVTLYGLTIRSVPTNVSVRLGQMPPFWTRLGELATAQISPDFAAVLNAFLAEATVENGFYAIPFVVHSDTIAWLDVTLAIDYVIEQPILPSYLPEVTLPFGFSSLPGIEEDLLTVKLPRGATIANTGGVVQGTFDATRVVFGEIGETGATATVTVSPDRALAQPIQLDDETPVSGIDLPLANTQPGVAGLHLALQEDADGKPSGTVLINTEVQVERPVPGGSAWGNAALPAEFRFLKDRRYWLVLQSVSGDAHWEVALGDSTEPALQASTDGTFSWRTAITQAGRRPLAALYRLRHTPGRYSVPIQLQVGEGDEAKRVRFDDFAPLGRVEFNLDFAAKLEEYLASPAIASPCGSGNLLVNGGFDLPPLEDAIELGHEHTLSFLSQAEPNFISGLQGQAMSSAWIKAEVPDGWQGDTGRIIRFKIGDLLFVLLVPPWFLDMLPGSDESEDETFSLDFAEPAELAQRIPVVGGCVYLLHFLYSIVISSKSWPLSFSRWELRWLDDTGQTLAVDGGELVQRLSGMEWSSPVIEARVVAPEAATEAELRFIQHSPGIMALEDASLIPTLETLDNSHFRRWENKDSLRPADWTPQGGTARPEYGEIACQHQVVGVRLRGDGTDDAVLVQTIEVVAEKPYELRIYAWPEPPRADHVESQPLERHARLELRWLADGDEVGEAAVLPLDGRDFPVHAWAGSAPQGATQAEVRLIQPRGGGDLVVSGVSLQETDLASVPLIFLAEAPGELTVSNLRVAYQPPLRLEEALPGVPGRRPPVEQPGAGVVPPPPPTPGVVVPSVVESPTLLAARRVGDIKGVGSALETSLTDAGIATIGDLAAVDLAGSISGVTPEQLMDAKAKAESILSVGAAPDAFPALADESLGTLLFTSPDDLVARSGRPRATIDGLQCGLRVLRLHLKNEVFRSLRLSDLMFAMG